jgi:Zn-dependent protease with chaperone function
VRTRAIYHDGKSSATENVELDFNADGSIYLLSKDARKAYALSDVSFSSRLGNTPRLLNFPDGASCHIDNNDVVDAFLKQHKTNIIAHWLHILESHIGYVLFAVAFTAMFTWGMIVHGIPYFATQLAYNLPESVERSLGNGTLEALDKTLFSPTTLDETTRHRLQQRFAEMKQQINHNSAYEMTFRHGGKIGANAFALPSGIIVVTDELVEASNNDDEVISILAHEIGHLVHRHSIRMVMQNSAVAVLVATITGDPFSTSSLIVALPTILVNSKYSREFEIEADDFAYQYLVDNNMDTEIFANILERIAGGDRESGFDNYLSSHPGTTERLMRFKNK